MEIHDENYTRSIDNMQQILARKLDYENAMKQTAKVNGGGESGSRIGWKPPQKNMVKLNTHDDRKVGNIARCEGIIRDE